MDESTTGTTGPADLRAWRIAQGLTQGDAGALFGVKQSVQSQRETGERGVPLGDALIIQTVTRGDVQATSFGHSHEAVAQALAAGAFQPSPDDAPVPPEFAGLVLRADAHAVGALAARGDLPVALAQYEASRLWTWELMGRCGVALTREAPAAAATPHDVLNLTAELFRKVPGARDDCGFCRACTDAKGVEKGAHEFAHAVRLVWCALTGSP